jgi:GTP-binding protein
MRFIDEAIIKVFGGHGGPGCISFRRETFVPRGGPDGGDGGQGGSVTFRATHQLGTLQDFRFKREYRAEAGNHGSGANKAGRDGKSIELRVPVGTLVHDAETGELLKEMLEDGETWVACTGGRGGKGNAHFVSSTFQAPKFAQPGEEGTHRVLRLELKLLADAAIIGFPNAGKSTLISRVSAAKPKIADYAFTTLVPNLGVVALSEGRSMVVADIPGLIEGAHRGLGLGTKFLRHIERTRLLVHLVDSTQFLEEATRPVFRGFEDTTAQPEDPVMMALDRLVERYQVIRQELHTFSEALSHKPEIVVLNKADVVGDDRELLNRARKRLRSELHHLRGREPLPEEPLLISAVSGEGIQHFLEVLSREVSFLSEQERARDPEKSALKLPNDPSLRR